MSLGCVPGASNSGGRRARQSPALPDISAAWISAGVRTCTSPGGVRRRNPPVGNVEQTRSGRQVRHQWEKKTSPLSYVRAKRTARTPTPRRALALPPRVFGGLTNMPFPSESPTRSTRRVHRGPRCGKIYIYVGCVRCVSVCEAGWSVANSGVISRPDPGFFSSSSVSQLWW